jgi:hypothetical protein
MPRYLDLSCRTDDPVDVVSRVLLLVVRCGIALHALDVRPAADGGFAARFRLATPLPFAADHLADRVRQVPFVDAVTVRAAPRRTTAAAKRSTAQIAAAA